MQADRASARMKLLLLFFLVPALPLVLGMTLTASLALAGDHRDHDSDGDTELPLTQVLPLKLALKAAVEAQSTCESQGFRVTAAVVDRGGLVKALVRGDGAGAHTPDSATKKAYTSASLGRPTSDLVDVVVSNPATEGLRDMNDNILILGGGLPIVIGGEIVGGIGVGGAPGGDLDEACAQAGIDEILDELD